MGDHQVGAGEDGVELAPDDGFQPPEVVGCRVAGGQPLGQRLDPRVAGVELGDDFGVASSRHHPDRVAGPIEDPAVGADAGGGSPVERPTATVT